jgi:hypothetical protein
VLHSLVLPGAFSEVFILNVVTTRSVSAGLALLPAGIAATPRLSVVGPLAIACLAVLVALPVAAARGRFHIPGYVGLAFLTFLLALVAGHFSGARSLSGTFLGLALAMLFFLLGAVAAGCFVALFFYRDPPDV